MIAAIITRLIVDNRGIPISVIATSWQDTAIGYKRCSFSRDLDFEDLSHTHSSVALYLAHTLGYTGRLGGDYSHPDGREMVWIPLTQDGDPLESVEVVKC